MIIENWALWLVRSFASSRHNHCTVIITMKASSFQNGSQICWCFRVENRSISRKCRSSKNKRCYKIWSQAIQRYRLIKFLFCKWHNLLKLVCLFTFFCFKVPATFSNFCKIFCSTEWIQQQQEFTNEIGNMEFDELRWLDPVFWGGYHPTMKLSGIPTFTFIVSLTHRIDNI